MTRRTNARIAGFTFLFYIAAGITSIVLSTSGTRADGIAARLSRIAEHEVLMRVDVLLTLFMALSAVVLGVTLYSLTRDEDGDIAALGMICRVIEGVLNAFAVLLTLAVLWLGTTGAGGPESASATAVGPFIFRLTEWNPILSATFFAVGSTAFSYLLLRGHMIPMPLAWLGVFASVLLAVVLPFQVAGFLSGSMLQIMWLPMALFEVALALQLIVKCVKEPA